MRKLTIIFFVIAICAISALGQSQNPPTLRIVTEAPNLPSDLYYGNTKVKPVRLRPGTNTLITIDDSDFFVQQQYVDFLSRFPDQNGFNYWNNQITGCGSDANCALAARVNTSGAFFLSTEFQQTGYFVYRFYKASFSRLPRYAELMPDTRQVGNGVVVLQPGWQATLEANKVAYANAWVNRADFQTQYGAMSNAQYVDALIANTGATFNQADRDALVNGLGGGTETRATALRKIVENNAFAQKEFSPAFVLMQYFGYLRRNPDDAPDTDFSGYNFWLNKLNQFNGDFTKAQMVQAFIQSTEYRNRF